LPPPEVVVSLQPKRGPEAPAQWRRPPQAINEIRKAGLTNDEGTRLADLMRRHASGRTLRADHKRLRDGVEELRLRGERRTFRLYFARIDEGLVLLALHFNIKKKNNDSDAIDLAADRLKRWRDLPDEI
jgi:putative component of toxin-antitoxin plasmid stabilization module